MRKYLLVVLLILMGALVACQSDPKPDNDNPESDENHVEKDNTENEENTNSSEVEGIEGSLWEGDGDTGVILSHGAIYDADSWEDQGLELAENGMTTFAVEDTSSDDIIKVAKILKSKYDVKNLAIIGASAGATSSIESTISDDVDFDKVVLLSPPGEPNDIDDIPVLVIYSEEEGFDELEDEKNENIETIVMTGSAHAQELFEETNSPEETMNHILDFLNEE